ncbi:hypothetical protein [Nocardia takedensis]|uniref:hypothetical protein n=1 Tax=Nocardia takedensis TaxID=259390 RepID=UPI0002D2F502|nr:hypothetical protein [Nocardia takedensis]
MRAFPAAYVAAALYDTFATTLDAFDSLEMWLAIAEEAGYQLTIAPDLVIPPRWIPVYLIYCGEVTDAEFHPASSVLRIVSGPLTGTTYPYSADNDTAARAVAAAHPDPNDTVFVVPTWRLRAEQTPAPIPRVPDPVTPDDARELMTR